jgi:hypothetical protein
MKLRAKGSPPFFLTSCRYAFLHSRVEESSVELGSGTLSQLNLSAPSSGSALDPCTSMVQLAPDSVLHPEVDLQPSSPTSPWQDSYLGLLVWGELGQYEQSVAPAMLMQPGLGDFNNFATAEPAQWDLDWNLEDFHRNGYAEQLLLPTVMEPQSDFAGTAGLHQPVPASLPASVNTPAPARPGRLNCPHGCPKTFGRPGDYRRHMGKHSSFRFICDAIGCKKTFYRKDKLNAHIRKVHAIDQ